MGACLLSGRDYFRVFVRVLSSSSLSTITVRSTKNTFNYLCEVVATGHATRYYSEKEHEILGKCQLVARRTKYIITLLKIPGTLTKVHLSIGTIHSTEMHSTIINIRSSILSVRTLTWIGSFSAFIEAESNRYKMCVLFRKLGVVLHTDSRGHTARYRKGFLGVLSECNYM